MNSTPDVARQRLVPNNRVFHLDANVDPIARWLFWHQLYAGCRKGEFALGLGLALSDAMGLVQQAPDRRMLVDMIADVQTVLSCLTAAELDPSFTRRATAIPTTSTSPWAASRC